MLLTLKILIRQQFFALFLNFILQSEDSLQHALTLRQGDANQSTADDPQQHPAPTNKNPLFQMLLKDFLYV